MAPQLSLFEGARYFDPRVGADRARARSLAKLRPARRCERGHADGRVVELPSRRAESPVPAAAGLRAA